MTRCGCAMTQKYSLWKNSEILDQTFLLEELVPGTIKITQAGAGGNKNKDFNVALTTLLDRLSKHKFNIQDIWFDGSRGQAERMRYESKKIFIDFHSDIVVLGTKGVRKKITSQLKTISNSATSRFSLIIDDNSKFNLFIKNLVLLGFIRPQSKNADDGELEEDPWGFVYLMVNPSFRNWVKIGKTQNHFERLNSYQTGDPYRAYDMKMKKEVENRHDAEKIFHQHFEKIAGNRSHEWFKIDLDFAMIEFEKLYELHHNPQGIPS